MSELIIRPMEVGDIEIASQMLVEGLNALAARHGFAPEFPSVASVVPVLSAYRRCPSTKSWVATIHGEFAACTFSHMRPGRGICTVGPSVVNPKMHAKGIATKLFVPVVEDAHLLPVVGIVAAWNTAMYSIISTFGLTAREVIVRLRRKPSPIVNPADVQGECSDATPEQVDPVDEKLTGGHRIDDLRMLSMMGKLVLLRNHPNEEGFLGMIRGTNAALLGPAAATSEAALSRLFYEAESRIGATHELSAVIPARYGTTIESLRARGWQVRDLLVLVIRGDAGLPAFPVALSLVPESF